ncbi:MAG: hypothetical protein U0610_05755 [bacterium]
MSRLPRKPTARSFLSLFDDLDPGLLFPAIELAGLPEVAVPVEHFLGPPPPGFALQRAATLLGPPELPAGGLRSLYDVADGAEICILRSERGPEPLLRLLPIVDWLPATRRLQPGGDLRWIVERNKWTAAASIYPPDDSWLVFGCSSSHGFLTLVRSGDRAGHVHYLAPESRRNVIHPLAKTAASFLERVASDVSSVLHDCEAQASFEGRDPRNPRHRAPWAREPSEYWPDLGDHPLRQAEPPRPPESGLFRAATQRFASWFR